MQDAELTEDSGEHHRKVPESRGLDEKVFKIIFLFHHFFLISSILVMANPRQRRKTRSSTHRPVSCSRNAKRNLKKTPCKTPNFMTPHYLTSTSCKLYMHRRCYKWRGIKRKQSIKSVCYPPNAVFENFLVYLNRTCLLKPPY